MSDALGLLLFAVVLASRSSASPPAITWLVVRFTPEKPVLDARERKNVLEARVLDAVRLGDRLVRDLAFEDVDAAGERRSRATASASPCSAIASTYGSVAFVSAFVDVTGTPPGMFATQ